MVNMTPPKNKFQVRALIVLLNYNRKCGPDNHIIVTTNYPYVRNVNV